MSTSLAYVRRMLCARPDRKAVEGVDQGDHNKESDDLVLGEMPPHLFISIIGSMGFRNPSQSLGPGPRRPLTVREQSRLVPGIEQKQPGRGLAVLERLAAVHVQAEGAAVDLRGSRLHEPQKLRLELRLSP